MHVFRLRDVVLGGAGAAACLFLAACGGGGGGGPTADVSGRILVVEDGTAPNPVATVSIGGASVQTDIDGFFILRSVSATSPRITVTETGFPTLQQTLPTLTANAVNDLGAVFISLDGHNAAATGRIVNVDNGNPIPSATVVLSGQRTVTGADGVFNFTGLPVGLGNLDYVVGVVSASGFPDKNITLNLPLGAPTTTFPVNDLGDIAMSSSVGPIPGGPANIAGTVTLQGSTTAAGVTVTLVKNGTTVDSVITGDDGKFGFWVAVGDYQVTASIIGFQAQSKPANLTKVDVPVTVNFTLVP